MVSASHSRFFCSASRPRGLLVAVAVFACIAIATSCSGGPATGSAPEKSDAGMGPTPNGDAGEASGFSGSASHGGLGGAAGESHSGGGRAGESHATAGAGGESHVAGGAGGTTSSPGGAGQGGLGESGTSGSADAGGGGEAGESNDGPGPGPTQQCTFTQDANGFFKISDAMGEHVVRLPVGYDVAMPEPQRLIVGLHGCGDTAFNHASWAVVPYAFRSTQDYIALSVGGRDGGCWAQDGQRVLSAIARVRECFYVHQKKIVVSGYSSGGSLAWRVGLSNAALFAGILIENANISQSVGASNVDAVLAGAAWKLNIALTARIQDNSYLIATTRADRDKSLAAGFPLVYRELAGTHDGSSDDWSTFLIPAAAAWLAP